VLHSTDIAEEKTVACMRMLCARRINGEPLQYILGEWEFMGLSFYVGEGVLIPRQETELLVEAASQRIKEMKSPVIFDLCAGTGCIGLSVAKLFKDASVYLLEKTDDAFVYLNRNKERLNISNAVLVKADIYKGFFSFGLPEPDIIHVPTAGDRITTADLATIIPLCKQADVVLCGPGLGPESHDVITSLAPYIRKGVFDADALRDPLPVAGESLYTPHAGEFARMSGLSPGKTPRERAHAIMKAQISGTVLLKGAVDVICDGSRVRFNQTGTPAMTTGGTGDVLAGVCAALMAVVPAFEAACIGAYVTGRAGELITQTCGYGMTARDLLTAVPQVLFRSTSERE